VPVVKVFNKIDLLSEKEELLEKNGSSDGHFVYVSAKTGDGIISLKNLLRTILFKNLELFYLRIPQSKRELVNSFSKWTVVLKRREDRDHIELEIIADPRSIINYLPYIKRGEKN
jgi:50S ribosomal subunit-associated GTPase HflX